MVPAGGAGTALIQIFFAALIFIKHRESEME